MSAYYLANEVTRMDTIMMLHGMGGPNPLNLIEEDVKKYMNVIKPVMPGFRASDNIIDYHDEEYVEYIEQIRKDKGIEQMVVLGYSMGGRTALNYTIQYPERVKQLILIDSAGVELLLPPLHFSWGKKVLKCILPGLLKYNWMQEMLGKQDFVDTTSEIYQSGKQWVADMMKSKITRINFVDILTTIGKPIVNLEEKLRKLNMPVLVLWAGDDKTAKVSSAYWLKEVITTSDLYILPGYRHMAPLEKPDFYTQHIKAFVSSTSKMH